MVLLLSVLLKAGSRSVTQQDVDLQLQLLEDSYRQEIDKLRAASGSAEFRNILGPDLDNPFDLDGELDDADPEVSPGLFEGDIAYIPNEIAQFRVALNTEIFPTRKWDTNVVPYIISPKYEMKQRMFIEDALDILSFMTCIKFVPWDGKVKDYLVIWPVKKPAGCWSFIGKLGGAQIVSLQPPDSKSKRCFISIGKPIHEIIHALGFFHEQSRFDRDQHVFVIKKHVIPRFLNNFAKHAAENTTIGYTYDFTSVMHYGTHFFSIDRKVPTMVPRVNNTVIGQRNGMSVKDCLKVNSYYGCMDASAYDRMKYSSICRLMGIRNDDTTFNSL
ncbi:zinc metalloproteinase nas-15-like [Pollicipes pollicipes]|uniref:zinc metalloproteinase nas-15-like n=1 Tax=Pollicipes pollicipes TaxID=41117 RepID=UPI00188571BF|nr:zinc metalloproteinase nas-15-like [Pollicipes pollicipes]